MSALEQLPHLLTVAEFLMWDAADGSDRWELVDGCPRAMSPSRARHGMIAAEAARLLGNHLAGHPRCRVVVEPGIKTDEYNHRIPDLGVTCEPVGADDLWIREPVVIVEVLSPSNARQTWEAVVRYMAVPSVREILVVHSQGVQAELSGRVAGGPWERRSSTAGDVVLASLGLTVPLVALYRTAGVL